MRRFAATKLAPFDCTLLGMQIFARNLSAKQTRGARLRSLARRIMFSLLTLWLHGVALFFISFVLFKGASKLNAAGAQDAHSRIVKVTLRTEDAPKPANNPAPAAQESPEKPTQQQDVAPVPETKQANASLKDEGVLSCSSLPKKPERIVYGPDDVEFTSKNNTPGYMVLRTTINREGTVTKVTVEETTMDPKLEAQTIAWAYRKVYHPGEIGGVAVDCELRYMVSTTLPP